MSQSTKTERKAIAAVQDAAAAAKFAKQVAKTLPAKPAKKLRAFADAAKDAADVSKKAIRKRPEKIAKAADKASARAVTATESALARQQRKAAEKAKKAAAERKAAEKKAAKKAAAKAAAQKKKGRKRDAAPRAAKPVSVRRTQLTPAPELAGLVAPTEPAQPEPATLEAVISLEPVAPAPEPAAESAAEPAAPARPRARRPRTQAVPVPALDTLTVAALRERARDAGRTGYSRLSKAQLIELLS
ncbi:hypothetical protein [Microbacterium sp. SS28]|uniref:hypothetical protein n=1 Tax=Microbacterium sp. SS28 TaxID=2919948 RepID=UPI00242D973E|nr:hypothetical protein [Microbacterium sp. SS28]